MQGKRIYPEDNLILNDGEYAFYRGIWYGKTPNGYLANLKSHKVVENEDGTITVSPSILVSTNLNGEKQIRWHGHLKEGFWKEC
jgi:hypothetical protein